MKKIFFLAALIFLSLSTFSQEILKPHTEEAKACIEKGNAMADNGDWKNALNEYNNAVGFDARNPEAYYRRALASQNLKDYRSAVNDYSKAIYFNDTDGNAYYGRGICFYELGRKKDCCIDLSKASGLGNSDAGTAMMNYCN
jgi:tetratricopeptide (TPR) repeat protein